MLFEVKPCRFGRGLFATRDIRKGDVILTFTGKIITQDDVDAKPEGKDVNALEINDTSYIDLEEPGVFANHSCNPTAGIYDDRKLIALRDIAPSEEVTYDYSTSVDGGWTMPCACGENDCVGYVCDFKDLPREKQERYLGLDVVMSYIAKQYIKIS